MSIDEQTTQKIMRSHFFADAEDDIICSPS